MSTTETYPIDNPVFYDLEVFPGWFEAGFKYQNQVYQYVITTLDRSQLPGLIAFLNWVESHGLPLVGFNSNHYDDPVLGEFLDHGGDPAIAYQTSVSIIQDGIKSWNFSDRFTSIDLMPVLPGRMSLKKLGVCLGHHKLQELPIPYDKTPTPEDAVILLGYNENDLDITEKVYLKIYDELKLRRTPSLEHGVDMRSKGRATIAEMILLSKMKAGEDGRKKKEINGTSRAIVESYPFATVFKPHWWDGMMDTHSMPSVEAIGDRLFSNPIPIINYRLDGDYISDLVFVQDRFFQMGVGGLHSIDSPGCWIPKEDELLMDIDVAMYYPWLILSNRVFPRAWGEAFLGIFKDIVDDRMEAKRLKKKLEDAVGKVVANGTFGKTSEPYSSLYDPQATANTTLPGQLALLALIELLQSVSTICSANTDGIMVLVKKDKHETLKAIVGAWEKATGLQMEYTGYRAFYQKDVNNYIALMNDPDSAPKQKGFFLDQWPDLEHTPSGNIIATAVVRFLDKNTPVEDTITSCVDINQFLLTQNLSKGWTSSWNGVNMGRILRFYKSTRRDATAILKVPGEENKGNAGLVAQSEGCVCVPDLPEEFPKDVNYKWYIDQASEMMERITWKKISGGNKWAHDLKVNWGVDLCLTQKGLKRIGRVKVTPGKEDFSTIPPGMTFAVMTGDGVIAKTYDSGHTQFLQVGKVYPSKSRPLVTRDHGFTLIYGGRVPITGCLMLWAAGEDLDQYYTVAELKKVGR